MFQTGTTYIQYSKIAYFLLQGRVSRDFYVSLIKFILALKRLDQGHLHSKLEVPGLTCLGRESNPNRTVGGEHSRKEPFEELVNRYSEHLHMSTRQPLIIEKNWCHCNSC